MELKEELKEFVLNGASSLELKREAIRLGMQTLRMSALTKARRGYDDPERSLPRLLGRLLGVPFLMANMHQLLKAMIEKGASDLHITTGTAPQLRIDGKLHPLRMPPLSPPETKQLCYSVLTDSQKHQFEEMNELDLSFSVQKLSRFRGNIFVQRGNVAGVLPRHSLQDQDLRGARAPEGGLRAGPEAAGASSWSRARRALGSRPRSPR